MNISDYSIDRYATAVVGDKPEYFDAIEIQGVREVEAMIEDSKIGTHKTDTTYTIDNDNPDSFSVYLHLIEGGVECVGDFSRHRHAQTYALELSDELSLEVHDMTSQVARSSCTRSAAPLSCKEKP